MTLTLKRKESVSKGLRRLAQRQIRASQKALKDCEKLDAVHEVRKGVKRLRGLLRLGRAALRGSDYLQCMGDLRQLARQLSAARDAHVKLNALKALEARLHDSKSRRQFGEFEEMLMADCRKEQAGLEHEGTPGKASRSLRALESDFSSLCPKRKGWNAIALGVRRTYRNGRRRYLEARHNGKAEDFHEWRKRVKDLTYQAGMLCKVCPGKMVAIEKELKRLGETLGDDHDLVMLTECEAMNRFTGRDEKAAHALGALADTRQQQLRSRALTIGGRLYAEKPSVFCKRLNQYWREWRKGS